MTVEAVTHIDDLDSTLPDGAVDPISEGDNHIRNIKSALKTTFPNVTGAINATHTEIDIAAKRLRPRMYFFGQMSR